MNIQHLNIKITGQVQGVFFRNSTKEIADQLKVKGFVQNLADGSLYIEAEGSKIALEKFIDWCHHGPDLAMIQNIEIKDSQLKNFTSFEIVYGLTKKDNHPNWC